MEVIGTTMMVAYKILIAGGDNGSKVKGTSVLFYTLLAGENRVDQGPNPPPTKPIRFRKIEGHKSPQSPKINREISHGQHRNRGKMPQNNTRHEQPTQEVMEQHRDRTSQSTFIPSRATCGRFGVLLFEGARASFLRASCRHSSVAPVRRGLVELAFRGVLRVLKLRLFSLEQFDRVSHHVSFHLSTNSLARFLMLFLSIAALQVDEDEEDMGNLYLAEAKLGADAKRSTFVAQESQDLSRSRVKPRVHVKSAAIVVVRVSSRVKSCVHVSPSAAASVGLTPQSLPLPPPLPPSAPPSLPPPSAASAIVTAASAICSNPPSAEVEDKPMTWQSRMGKETSSQQSNVDGMEMALDLIGMLL
ncbi:hypothetical protein M5K25_014565 [Dendrobium thyrsiflorum]|uniref:Uncharacterized protein n=1 Tax=Dendrobium thyrsiflorum TaxID=117978 RepID=A0ABD0UN36_DENTH